MTKEKKFFVTTPIYYINDVPHIGHAYATFAADILARYHRQIGNETFFLTGTDENSQKTVLAAEKAGEDTTAYTDELAAKWQETWKDLNISNDDFIRTTEKRHQDFVIEFFKKIQKAGDIYKGKYEGLYCVGHEAFLKKEDLDPKGFCPDHKTKPENLVEENYFFKLSKYQKQIEELFEKNPEFVSPKERFREIYNFVKSGLQDISITRQSQKWGIPAPNDPNQVIYVWFDALINYLSASPDKWPADLHIVGKDIIRFHAVIWPAMLLSTGYPLPKQIFAHGFFTINGEKISKSLGNSVDPLKIAAEYGTDALRYFLFKEIPFGNDGDFSFERLNEVYNSDLANGLGNLVSRVAKLAEKSGLSFAPAETTQLPSDYQAALENLDFQKALESLWKSFRELDLYLEKEKPWEVTDQDKLKTILEHAVSEIIKTNQRLKPFLPETAEKIKKQFLQTKIVSSDGLFPRR